MIRGVKCCGSSFYSVVPRPVLFDDQEKLEASGECIRPLTNQYLATLGGLPSTSVRS